MACDMFSMQEANTLLRGKYIHFFGDSNSRALYKDLLWLLEDGRIIPETRLKTKNEESHANDYRISNGACHNGHDYDERREYYGSAIIKFEFITRLFRSNFIDTIRKLIENPRFTLSFSFFNGSPCTGWYSLGFIVNSLCNELTSNAFMFNVDEEIARPVSLKSTVFK
ncbi:hypothetical protein FQR65_LT07137 [Abscondita terminalis]|nr:hypothetical protein FQR65_LT07137 [Abscondita terminalis]